jgi:nucleoside permease NupC
LKFYQQLTGKERRIPFIFDDFHFCRSRVIGLDMTENRIFTLSYDNLGSVSQNILKFYQQLTGEERRIPFIFDDFHFCRSRVIRLDMTENRIFTLLYDNLGSVSQNVLKFYQQLTGEERRVPFIFGRNNP